jgi:hypothetical protein
VVLTCLISLMFIFVYWDKKSKFCNILIDIEAEILKQEWIDEKKINEMILVFQFQNVLFAVGTCIFIYFFFRIESFIVVIANIFLMINYLNCIRIYIWTFLYFFVVIDSRLYNTPLLFSFYFILLFLKWNENISSSSLFKHIFAI